MRAMSAAMAMEMAGDMQAHADGAASGRAGEPEPDRRAGACETEARLPRHATPGDPPGMAVLFQAAFLLPR
jgi:hypothetical protein